MKQAIKYLAFFLILTTCTFSLSGCYNIYNIDKIAYVVALGFDVGENNNLKISFQLSIPNGSGSGDSSTTQSADAVVNTIECSSLSSGVNIINSYLSKKINLSHCKVIVLSEELAYSGVSKIIYSLANSVQVRPDCNVIVSRCSANYFLDNSKPILEKLAARYYEIAPTSSEYTGYTENVKLGTFFYTLTNTYNNAVAILGGVNTEDTHKNSSNETGAEKDSSYKANQTTIETKPNIETLGLAVFHGDTLVGELNAIETLCHMIVSNKMDRARISIPSPFVEGDTVDLELRSQKSTKNTVKLINNSPYITVKPTFEARVLSMSENSEYLNEENIDKIETYAESYLQEQILQYLYKTAKVFHSDIDSFGKHVLSNFIYWNDWKEYDWLENYKNAFFDVTVDMDVLSGLLLMQT